jgi:chaperone required for assembly of F1-ATPase
MVSLKRFYKTALAVATNDKWTIHLDERPLKTPEQKMLVVDDEAIAIEIAREWSNQNEIISPSSMPVHNIIVTSTDKSDAITRQAIVNELTPYIDGDLIFYHAPDPIGLTELQGHLWGSAIDQFEKIASVKPEITHDLVALRQTDNYHAYITHFIENLSSLYFTIFQLLVSLSGSPLCSLLLIQNEINAEEFDKITHAESDFYQKHYKFKSEDIAPEEIKAREQFRVDLDACDFILRTLQK